MNKEIVISVKTIAITLLGVLGVYVIYRLGPIFGMLLVAWILTVALEPVVHFFEKMVFLNKPLPRGVAVILTFIIFIGILILLFTLGLPPVLTQASKLLQSLSTILENPIYVMGTPVSFSDFLPDFGELSKHALSFTSAAVSNITSVITVLFLSLYMSLDWENIKQMFVGFFTGRLKKKVEEIVEDIEVDVGHWVKGQLTLMVVVGSLSLIGLVIARVPYALALSILAGTLEIIPLFGPLIASVLGALVGFTISPTKGFITLGIFILVQQLENNFLVPKIMHKVSGFSSLFVLIAVIAGGQLFGLAGVVLAVPVVMISWIIFRKVSEYFAGS